MYWKKIDLFETAGTSTEVSVYKVAEIVGLRLLGLLLILSSYGHSSLVPEHNFFWQRHLIPYVSRCRGQIDIFKWCSFISKIPENLSIIYMCLSFNKVLFATQFIISDVYPNVWKSFRFKVSPTCIPYICAEGFITDTRNSVHLTGNTFTKKQFLFAFTNEVNIMHLSVESPQPPTWENMGHGWGFEGALTLCPCQGSGG